MIYCHSNINRVPCLQAECEQVVQDVVDERAGLEGGPQRDPAAEGGGAGAGPHQGHPKHRPEANADRWPQPVHGQTEAKGTNSP